MEKYLSNIAAIKKMSASILMTAKTKIQNPKHVIQVPEYETRNSKL